MSFQQTDFVNPYKRIKCPNVLEVNRSSLVDGLMGDDPLCKVFFQLTF